MFSHALGEALGWRVHARVEKWDADQTAYLVASWPLVRTSRSGQPRPEDFRRHGLRPMVVELPGNLLTTAGVTRLASLLAGAGGQAATNTAARIGVGNGGGTAAVGDTDLSASAGSANRWFQVMDATYPQLAAGVATFRSTFASSDGNFAWNEWGIDIGTPTVSSGNTVAAVLLNHKTSAALGTKASGSTWTFTATVTLS